MISSVQAVGLQNSTRFALIVDHRLPAHIVLIVVQRLIKRQRFALNAGLSIIQMHAQTVAM